MVDTVMKGFASTGKTIASGTVVGAVIGFLLARRPATSSSTPKKK